MSHLEQLLAEFYDWQGYLVKRNIRVGKLAHGGWEMELDIVAYHPQKNELLHVEPSLDADSWEVREKRFSKKFAAGLKYIHAEVFKWLKDPPRVQQFAVFVSAGQDRQQLAGATVRTIDAFVAEIVSKVRERGILARAAIPEQYPLLRTIQLVACGYSKNPSAAR